MNQRRVTSETCCGRWEYFDYTLCTVPEHGVESRNTFALSRSESLTGCLSIFTGLYQSQLCQAVLLGGCRDPISAMIESKTPPASIHSTSQRHVTNVLNSTWIGAGMMKLLWELPNLKGSGGSSQDLFYGVWKDIYLNCWLYSTAPWSSGKLLISQP